jgi:hypothetical protein
MIFAMLWYLQCYDICNVMIFAMLWYLQCYYVCNVIIFSILWYLQCYYICNVIIFVMLLYLQCYYICNVIICAILWHLQCYDICNVMVFAMLHVMCNSGQTWAQWLTGKNADIATSKKLFHKALVRSYAKDSNSVSNSKQTVTWATSWFVNERCKLCIF